MFSYTVGFYCYELFTCLTFYWWGIKPLTAMSIKNVISKTKRNKGRGSEGKRRIGKRWECHIHSIESMG